jgi:hypothetical protein
LLTTCLIFWRYSKRGSILMTRSSIFADMTSSCFGSIPKRASIRRTAFQL